MLYFFLFSNKCQLFLDNIIFSRVWVKQVTFSKARLLNAVTLKLKDYKLLENMFIWWQQKCF